MAVQKRRTKSTAAEPETPLQASTAAENPPAFAQMVQPSDGLASALNQVSQSQPVAQPGSPPLVSARLHSDLWAREDQLGYALYAKSIAEFIHHRQTAPTLAIAVLAPWGRGKTTLMRLVQQQLVKKANRAPSSGAETGSPRTALRPQATFGDLRSWLKGRADFRPAKVRYPTVWFNAWKYESSEQVWAGLAHEILSQLVEQLPDQLEREKFWLMLQARRVDVAAVRRDLLGVLIEQFVGRLFTWSTLGLGGVALLAGGAAAWLAGGAAGLDFVSGGTVSGLGGLLIAVRKWMEGRAKPLDGAFARYVRRPDYEGKRGFLAEVEEDVRIAFDLLVSREEPAVVFVDDLDRCSPGKVADVIEALNLFLSGDFPGCYFVIGMDAQVVAASMEVAHKELTEKLQGLTRTHGSLGWYFMDKFVQLPFVIPSLSDQQRGEYLLRLFSGPHAEEAGDSGPPEAQEAEAALRRVLGSGAYAGDLVQQVAGPLQELRHKAPDRAAQYAEQAIERGAHQFTDEDPEIIGQLQAYTPFLGASPRTIKRFANLYRFYRMIQWTRQFQGLEYADPPALGKWLTIMLRWPQLVRWIQWEGEASLPITGAGPTQRAARFEELLHRSADYAAWLDVLDQNAVTRNSWCCDQSLFDLLKRSPEQESDLVRALNVGVW